MDAIIKEPVFTAERWQILEPGKTCYFTADDVIDAYFMGKEVGLSQTKKALVAQLSNNITKTVGHRNDLFNYLLKNKYPPQVSYLKILSWDRFEILFVVSEKDFLNEKFLAVYEYINKFEKEINNDLYSVFFRFTNSSEHFDEDQLDSDGFVLKHVFTI